MILNACRKYLNAFDKILGSVEEFHPLTKKQLKVSQGENIWRMRPRSRARSKGGKAIKKVAEDHQVGGFYYQSFGQVWALVSHN